MKWRRGRLVLLALCGSWLGMAWYQTHKLLPAGMRVASAACLLPQTAVRFVADITAADAWGHPLASQGILDEELAAIRGARRFIVLDFHRFGGAAAATEAPTRSPSRELTQALLAQRHAQPQLQVLLLIDPANEAWGTRADPLLTALRQAGVAVVAADLDELRDSNPAWSSLWRLTLRWWLGPATAPGIAARRLNFKASDRRLLLADDGNGALLAVIGSANPYDPESAWSNIAIRFTGPPLRTLLASELALARQWGWRGETAAYVGAAAYSARCVAATPDSTAHGSTTDSAGVAAQILTEGAARSALLQQLMQAQQGDSIDIAASRLAERAVVEELLAAAHRGAAVRAILDPNDAAGTGTAGIPNQPVASELAARGNGALHVRWYRTHGGRFQGSMVAIRTARGLWLLQGSAALTRRGLDDYNLEADVAIAAARDSPLDQQTRTYFDSLWNNDALLGVEYTADFAVYADPSQVHYWLYRAMEETGLSSF
ncbi:MAG: hypothetical protein JSR67_08395 [Proteobacteria bacterium]|nr:hypothetical protein [Pseudomonadota bacterium]